MSDAAVSHSVILDYIDHEISHTYDSFRPEVRTALEDAAKFQFRGAISYEDCRNTFLKHNAGDVLPKKIQQILDVAEAPLPPPADQGGLVVPKGSRRKSYPWTDAEDMRLLVAVDKFGARDWRLIAEFVGSGRNSSQCNQRWCRALDPSISHKSWSEADDYKLLRTVEVLGKTSWCQVAKVMTGRTDLQCRYRYLQLMKLTENSTEKPDPGQMMPPAWPVPEQEAPKRRNSISIAMFAIDFDKIEAAAAAQRLTALPYYLDETLMGRNPAPSDQFLHRVPPLLSSRVSKE